VEPYMVDPTNSDGLSPTAVTDALTFGIGEWETAAGGANILGDEIAATLPLAADTVSPDDKNEVYFADIADSGAIGVTIIWGIFGGPPARRELVEWDQIYDDADFDWDNLGDPTKMDFANIAIHELGHSCGMGDLYTPECSEQTMYGYATNGETKKVTLEDGDIAGIQELYR
ncbi:MAG: matrixin family metalloprotease, partial [Planctomycetota bacterium]